MSRQGATRAVKGGQALGGANLVLCTRFQDFVWGIRATIEVVLWLGGLELAMSEASPRGSLFDHSPMAPPIVHLVRVPIAAGYLLGPGTLEKGGCGLSRPGGISDFGFRV